MDYYVGEIRAFAGNFAPVDFVLCNGASLAIAEYQTLYALIGTTYGGDGVTNFNVPNLCGRIPVNVGQGTGLASTYALGKTAGAENVTLQTANLPAHNHAVNAVASAATTNVPQNNYLATPGTASGTAVLYLPSSAKGATVAPLDPTSLFNTGGGQPHPNLMPYLTINYIIATVGIYPTNS